MKKKTALTTFICFLLISVMLLFCISCGSLKVKAEELSKGYSRKATTVGQVTEEFKLAMADFSFEMFQGLITNDENNDLVSPLSAVICLAMIANGADGETKAQMERAFGMDIDMLNSSLYAYTSSLYSAKDCKVNFADSIWFRDDENRLHVNESFLQTNADWYKAQIYAAKFDGSTLRDINNWCKHYTDDMIKKMIDEIDADSIMYLINALTFDAKWADKYEKRDVNNGKFTSYNGLESTVKMLSSVENVYLSDDGATGFAKGYSGDKYSIVALLPNKGTDVYDYVNSLSGAKWLSIWQSKTASAVSVKMPEFTYSAHMNLNETLRTMGMIDMFGGDANFSKLGTSSNGNIYCSEVEQKVFIQVDRNGTKAAAITWGGMKDSAQETLFVTLDRPFVYAIVDNVAGLPLFLGVVSKL